MGGSAGLAAPVGEYANRTALDVGGFGSVWVARRGAANEATVRGEVSYAWNGGTVGAPLAGERSLRQLGLAATLVLPVRTTGRAHPYVLAGLGGWRVEESLAVEEPFASLGGDETRYRVGINAGVGLRLPLGAAAAQLEVRYQSVAWSSLWIQSVPIVLGVEF